MSHHRFLALVIPALLLAAGRIEAATYTFEVFRFPDALGTFPNGIDNDGNISGNLTTSDPHMYQRGFYREAGGNFEYIDYPGRNQTVPLGINNLGQIVGDTVDSNGQGRRGFIRDANGAFEEFVVPGSGFQVNDINGLGQIVGGVSTSGANACDSFLRAPNGDLQYFNVLPTQCESAYGINDDGIASGTNGYEAFLLDTTDGTFDVFEVPGATQTQFFGINNLGQVAGVWYSPTEGHHGFVRSPDGSYDELILPGGGLPTPWGINDLGQVVGHYDIPGDNTRYGFLATPVPEPSSSLLLAACGIGLALFGRRRSS